MAAVIITLLCIVLLLYNYFMFNSVEISSVVVYVLIIMIVWWIGGKFDDTINNNLVLESSKADLTREMKQVTKELQVYEHYFKSFEGGALFTYDLIERDTRCSIRIEQLFGFTQNQFNSNVELWKDLVHPDDMDCVQEKESLLYKGNSVEMEFRVVHPSQGEKWIRKISNPVTNPSGEVTRINGQFMDVTKHKQLEIELRRMAYFDDLTDLPNRKMLDRHIQKALARSKRHNYSLSIMFIDIDDFKKVNDTLGHSAGDHLLKDVVQRFSQSTREEDLIARIGGDEFIVVLEETSKDEIEDIANRLIANIIKPYTIDGKEVQISVSIGVSMYPENGDHKEELIQRADKAMYYAKNNGKNNYKLYTVDLQDVTLSDESIFSRWFNRIQHSLKS
ncbi:diguanylate cyclase/phosphodiesterase [Gracilibacillus boraciitolerans JCM 21714]|uniref:Diguanylate cyclase/phosphodiesterase n=1 Tax=Gracilibacillus boraciitolerans JCM 21714 TaxID=1298598 RepID=W4VD60_9BACI|nr:sensor domain-containing diguanylate cyclase [Gracilibacillus boraciitolerans]GAE91116.1 diguanylate cyclase/phosphodiesterase [Gracilibacillus boraciitolerans JCM 21714]